MIKKVKSWLEEKGLKNIGIIIAAAVLFIFFKGAFFDWAGLILLGVFIGLNWQSIKDLSEIDEMIVDKVGEAKKELQDQIDELKKKLIGLK